MPWQSCGVNFLSVTMCALLAAPSFVAKQVTVTGTAQVSGGNLAAAREAAVRQAQRLAIEQVLGAYVESEFSAEQREVAKDDKSAFSSTVRDKILTKSEGFIQSQKILAEAEAGGVYKVNLLVEVRAASLQDELTKLRALLAAQGYPKVMVAVRERYSDKSGRETIVERSAARALVEDALLGYGITLVGPERADKLGGKEALFAELRADPVAVTKAVSAAGADIIVEVDVPLRFTGFNELNDNMFYVAGAVGLRAIKTATAQVLASCEVSGKGIGINEATAREKVLKHAAPAAVGRLFDSMVSAWQQEAERGVTIAIVVSKVKNYAKLGRPLLKALERLPNVQSVKETQFSANELRVEVLYKGVQKQLVDAIFDDIASKREFQRLDKLGEEPGRLRLSL